MEKRKVSLEALRIVREQYVSFKTIEQQFMIVRDSFAALVTALCDGDTDASIDLETGEIKEANVVHIEESEE